MILEHCNQEERKYRWCNNDNSPQSNWFTDITDALEWIIKYDKEKSNVL